MKKSDVLSVKKYEVVGMFYNKGMKNMKKVMNFYKKYKFE